MLSRILPWLRNQPALISSHVTKPLVAENGEPVSSRPHVTWHQAVTFHQHFTGLGFQGWHDDGPGVRGAVILQAPLGLKGAGVVPGAVLHGVGAGVAGRVGVGRVVDCDTADDVFPLLGDSAGNRGRHELKSCFQSPGAGAGSGV